ncbi:MAG: hypothetical protein AAF098_08495 [Pseudomonadota bacterium]
MSRRTARRRQKKLLIIAFPMLMLASVALVAAMIFSNNGHQQPLSPRATLLDTENALLTPATGDAAPYSSNTAADTSGDSKDKTTVATLLEDQTDLLPEDPNDLDGDFDPLAEEFDVLAGVTNPTSDYSASGPAGFSWGTPGVNRARDRSAGSEFSSGGFLGIGGGFGGFAFTSGSQEPASIFDGIVAAGLMRGEVGPADIDGMLLSFGAEDSFVSGICSEEYLSMSPCTPADFDPSELLAALGGSSDICDIYAGGLTISPCNYGSPTPEFSPPTPQQPRIVNFPGPNPGPNGPPPDGDPDDEPDPKPPGSPDPEPKPDPLPPEEYAEVPAPASILLLSIGLLMLRRRV